MAFCPLSDRLLFTPNLFCPHHVPALLHIPHMLTCFLPYLSLSSYNYLHRHIDSSSILRCISGFSIKERWLYVWVTLRLWATVQDPGLWICNNHRTPNRILENVMCFQGPCRAFFWNKEACGRGVYRTQWCWYTGNTLVHGSSGESHLC